MHQTSALAVLHAAHAKGSEQLATCHMNIEAGFIQADGLGQQSAQVRPPLLDMQLQPSFWVLHLHAACEMMFPSLDQMQCALCVPRHKQPSATRMTPGMCSGLAT